MGRSSLLGLEHAAIEPAGRDTAALGPGDNSDSGSDRMGLDSEAADDPVERHPARRGVDVRGAGTKDIGVDRIFTPGHTDADATVEQRDDEDPDLAFIDSATAGDPVEQEDELEEEDGVIGGLEDEGDNIPGAHPRQRRKPMPGQNPAPDTPDNPGLPGDGDDDNAPADNEADADQQRPGRAAGA